jgi:hypothetical protein
MDESRFVAKLSEIEKLIQDLVIFTAVQAGANKHELARMLKVKNSRISKISKLMSKRESK